jgi:hypothetical protein
MGGLPLIRFNGKKYMLNVSLITDARKYGLFLLLVLSGFRKWEQHHDVSLCLIAKRFTYFLSL